MGIGKALKQIRTSRNLSLREVAERCEPPLDIGYLSKVENEKVGLGPDMLARLGDALELPQELLSELGRGEVDPVIKIYTALLESLFSKETNNNKYTNDWDSKKWLNEWEPKDKWSNKWELVLPKFSDKERIPSLLRMKLISQILSLEKSELEFISEVIEAFLRQKSSKLELRNTMVAAPKLKTRGDYPNVQREAEAVSGKRETKETS